MGKDYQNILDELKKASSEELDDFASLLRINVSTTSNQEKKLKSLDGTFRQCGGHSLRNFANCFEGPSYKEIVLDVADKYNIEKEGVSVPDLEKKIVCKVIRETLLDWRLSTIIALFNCLELEHELTLHDEKIENKLPNALDEKPIPLFRSIIKEVLRYYKEKYKVNYLGGKNYYIMTPGVLFIAMLRHK